MHQRALLLPLAAALVFAGSEADAAVMRVDYSLSGVANIVGIAEAGPVGGTLTIYYYGATGGITSGSAGSVFHGLARINLSGQPAATGFLSVPSFSFTYLGNQFTGFASGTIAPGLGVGTLTSGFGDLLLPVAGTATGLIHCTGLFCGLVGISPSVSQLFTLPIARPTSSAPNGSLSAPLVGSISGTIAPTFAFAPVTFGTFGGFTLTAMITATEIARHYLPEPPRLPALVVGLGLLGICRRLRRR